MKNKIYNFLKTKGFILVKEQKSEMFGDCIEVLSSKNFELIFICSRSSKSIDIRKRKSESFDLALVKALLYNESDLSIGLSLEEYCFFLESEFDKICQLFIKANYKVTKKKLKGLEIKRMRQLFQINFKYDLNKSYI